MKIYSLDLLSLISRELREQSLRVVLCHGVFDLPTIGHIKHLKAARGFGDVMMVTVTPDKYVNKPGRPLFGERLRMEAMAGLECVNYVALNQWETAIETIQILQPRFYVKGGEYRDAMTSALKMEAVTAGLTGGKLVFTDELETHVTDVLKRLGG